MPFTRRDIAKFISCLPLTGLSSEELNAATDQHNMLAAIAGGDISRLLPIKSGDITALLGRACNGKSTLALSVAMEYAENNAGEIWYFSTSERSRETAQLLGLILEQQPTADDPTDYYDPQPKHYRAYKDGKRLPITFVDEWFATNMSVWHWPDWAADIEDKPPALIIYDLDHLDITTLSNEEEFDLTADLDATRKECRRCDTAVLVTMKLPSGMELDRIDKRPRMDELKPRRNINQAPLVDEVFFVHRPALYEHDWNNIHTDHVEVLRASRVRSYTGQRVLVKDPESDRFREPDSSERELLGNQSETHATV